MSHSKIQVSCSSEYAPLKSVLLCPPQYMKIEDIINETQKEFQDEELDAGKAVKQHREFLRLLKENGIETHLLEPDEQFPEQVFTRDIGFTLGNTLFIANMEMDIRQGEERILKEWLDKEGIKYVDLKGAGIEGGDVLINGNTVYAGISERTSEDSIAMLENHLPDYEIIPIPIKKEYLHLDCIFNIISEKEALLFPEALRQEEIDLLSSRFSIIEVKDEDQFRLGVNVFSLGNKKIIALPHNKHTNDQLRKLGYEVIETDLSEIIKSGGAFRCCTMPLRREG
ncbi:dimethylarginine dimethylaminohydrolase family protein [Metabacillus sp. KIGAM252]|uniref:Dimethylarginine dimethylaminohydrolase family protein n=1 Tax=Metabacillus flavus TaxID=2823519 RepID=A0ABS5LBK8_9BACI|nr:dimethylarginine dimethylaminohydrolase family protein [Metabacillus flavus]MBS2968113.1 dimethylarginine dimethylaminohydrolase family protein [Metabacillus flavus]